MRPGGLIFRGLTAAASLKELQLHLARVGPDGIFRGLTAAASLKVTGLERAYIH